MASETAVLNEVRDSTYISTPFEGMPASLGPGLRTASGAKRRREGGLSSRSHQCGCGKTFATYCHFLGVGRSRAGLGNTFGPVPVSRLTQSASEGCREQLAAWANARLRWGLPVCRPALNHATFSR